MCTRVASVEELESCIKHVENSLRTGLGLFHWSRKVSWCRHPAVAAGGRSLAARLPCYVAMFCKKWQLYVTNNSFILQSCHEPRHRSSRLLPHNRALLISVRNSWEGGLNCDAKVQVLVVTPSHLFFLEVGYKKGGRNSGPVQYVHLQKLIKTQKFVLTHLLLNTKNATSYYQAT